MKREVVVEVYVGMLLKEKNSILLLFLMMMMMIIIIIIIVTVPLFVKLIRVYNRRGTAACSFTISTNHHCTLQAIWRAISFHS
jgi:heme/copper-type cytochrome/quinol oxidase subunit 2